MGQDPNYFEKPRSVAIINDKGEALAAAIYSHWMPSTGTMQLSFAAKSSRWATRQMIIDILQYPYEVCGIQKLWTATPHTNERALKLNRGLGFKQEAILGRHFGDSHAVICRMFKEDYIRLWGKNGQKRGRISENARSGANSTSASASE
jgi:hypothetical protein